jgi:hypothetical protein
MHQQVVTEAWQSLSHSLELRAGAAFFRGLRLPQVWSADSDPQRMEPLRTAMGCAVR